MKVRALSRGLIIVAFCVGFIPLILLQLQLLSTKNVLLIFEEKGTPNGPNLLVDHFTNESTIGYHGWWMSHARWGVASSCDSRNNNCPHAYTVQCKVDGIKCLHQFNVLSSHKIIRGFIFTLSYSTRYMEHLEVNSFIGAVVYVRLQDYKVIQKRLPLPTLDEAGELTETIDLWPQEEWRKIGVVSVAVSLCCIGIEGLAKFWNVELRPIVIDIYPITTMTEKLERREQYIMQCPNPLLPPNPPAHDYSEEILLTPRGKLSSSLITLVMQMSVDRIDMLSLNAAVWDGPMSIVIYFPAKSASDTDHTWKRKYVEKKINRFHLHSYTHLTAVYAHSVLDSFPINTLRNLAMKNVYTDYMLLLDGDFIVSPHFESSFHLAVTQTQSLLSPGDHVTYVVPAFELVPDKFNSHQYISPFYTKQELVSWVKKEDTDVVPFRSLVSPLAHYSTNYMQWYMASVPYLVTDYRDKYEPYLVLRRADGVPRFNEWFEDYGMNKVTHIMELRAAGYRFVVLPDNWAIHVPHEETKYAKQFLMDLDKRIKNRILRFEFITNLFTKYKLDGCKV